MANAKAGAERPKRGWLSGLSTFQSLKHADFRLLWVTSLVNAGSNWLQQVTLGYLAYDISGSALLAAFTFGVRSLPQLIVSPIGGVLGDRFDRKRSVQLNSAYMAILASGFAALLIFGHVQPWHILVYSFMQGLAQSLVQPTRQALVSNTVPPEDLMNAISLNSFAQTMMRLIGPAIAGVLIALSGPALNFSIQSVAFILTFLMLIPMKTPYTSRARQRAEVSMRESFSEGLRYVVKQPTILGLMALAVVPTLFTTPVNLGLLPVIAKDRLGIDSDGLGLLYSAQGLGAVIGTFTLASFSSFRRRGMVVSIAAVCLSITITLYSQVTVFAIALPLVAIGTCCFMTYSTMAQTIIQSITPDEYRGRVMGLFMINNGLTPFGTLIFGGIAELYGVQNAIIVAGTCAMLSVTFILLRFPVIWKFRSNPAGELEELPAPERPPARVGAASTAEPVTK